MIEAIGIIASICVLVSFTFKKQKTIRCVNMIGCVLFVVYGILINAFSVIFLNVCTMLVHIYFLKRKKYGL